MKNITLTPKGLISVLLSISLLCNMTAPAFAQSRVPSSDQIQRAVVRQLPDPSQDQIMRNVNLQELQQITEFKDRQQKGSLTDEQVQRVRAIESIFSPVDLGEPVKSDFEVFQETYLNQIDSEFKRESKALEDSRREVQRKIDANEQGYRNEIYTSILPKAAERVLKENNASREISDELLKEITNISFDKKQTLAAQLDNLASNYETITPQADLLAAISQTAVQEAGFREEAINSWKEQAEKQLNDWYTSNIDSLGKWQKEAKQNIKEVFEKEYEPQLLKEREAVVRESVKTLWNYKDLGPLASDTLLHVAPFIAPMSTLEGDSFFTGKQKDWLVNHYVDILRANRKCGENSAEKAPCEAALHAIGGLSMLADSKDAADEIEAFMTAKQNSAFAVPALLMGTVALLSMKQYGVLRGFLYRATQAEYNMDNVDIFSFETMVNSLANRDGHYLGEVSKYGQYPLHENANDKTALGNVWEDIAQILADEGSSQALDLLREFGVERCYVSTYLKTSFEKEQRVGCGGIIPFLAGALISGKSGAEQYNSMLTPNTQPGYTISRHGSDYVSPEQAQQNRTIAKQNVQNFRQFAAEKGLTNAGMLIRHLFLQSMGDLSAESELRLDTRLYEAFQAQKQTPREGFALISYTRNSPEYNAKRLRQDRTQIFRKIGRLADVAILVWCLVDLTKWAVSGVKIAGALTKMSRMARGGATVMQRAAYLRRLKIAPKVVKFARVPAKVKTSAAPTILATLPQFTNQAVKLPNLPGAVKPLGVLTAENLTLSAETGNLLVNYQGLRASGLTAKQAFDIKKTIEGAAQTTNTAFANSHRFALNKNGLYTRSLRKTLGEELNAYALSEGPRPYAFSRADRATVLDHVASMPLRIPSNIETFKTPELFGLITGKNFRGFAPSVNRVTLGGLLARSLQRAPETAELDKAADLVTSSLYNANIQFAEKHWWQHSNKQYKKVFLNNLTATFDADGQVFKSASYREFYNTLFAAVEKDASLMAPSNLSFWRGLANTNQNSRYVALGKALFIPGAAAGMQELPLAIQADPSLKPVQRGLYQRVTFTPSAVNNEPFVELGLDGKRIPLVKVQLNAQEVPALFTAAAQADMPLKLKITASQPTTLSSFWNNFKLTHKTDKKRYFFRGRGELFTHEIPVSIRQADGSLQGTKIVLSAESHLGWRNTTAVLDGKNLLLYKDGKTLHASNLAFSLPKNQLNSFLDILRATQPEKPFSLTLTRGKNKIKPLMWANGLSLSAASSGLIVPLENTYGDQITETDKIMISLALPYIPALLSPVMSPFVMRYGALNVLKTSMVFSLAGLGFAGLAGFRGYASQQSPLPPLWPLFVSGAAIGMSSALSRVSLNLLIDGMGGGGQLLKSMLAKNVGSVALLLPPFVANFIDKDIDFSLAFPL